MADHDKKMSEYYNARAPEYEQIYYRDIPDRRREIDIEAERLEGLADGKSVIDLACGSGYWTEILARAAKSVLAVDASQEMLDETAKKDFKSEVTLVKSDMFEVANGQQFDLVSSGFWFSHQPKEELDQFYNLLKRLVKRDGLIWLIENNPPAESSVNESHKTDEHGNNYKIRKLDDGTEFVILKNYFSEAELCDLFSPHFKIESLIHNQYYWSLLLRLKS